MDNVIHCFHFKGKKNHSIYLQSPISCMSLLQITKSRVAKALVVATNNGEVRLYNGKHLISVSKTNDVVAGIKLGTFGREEGSMVLSFKSGALMVKILQRSANLEVANTTPGPPPEQDIPLDVPKKTKLYVEQTKRERLHATEMHRTFQRDLCKLRLDTARSYVKIITDGQGPMSYTSGSSIRLSAQVQGLGALFSIKILVQNTGTKPIFDINLVATFNQQLYKVERPHIPVPVLVPGLQYKYHLDILCIDEDGSAEPVQVYVCGSHSVVPMISAIVNMPLSDIILGDE